MSGKHLQSLDGLRGVAILLVVLYHLFPHRGAGPLGYLTSGAWCGVDLFFVLSGFLITGILFDTQGAPYFYRNFYIRRTLRLSPVYILFIAFAVIFTRQPTGHPWYVSAAFILYASTSSSSLSPPFSGRARRHRPYLVPRRRRAVLPRLALARHPPPHPPPHPLRQPLRNPDGPRPPPTLQPLSHPQSVVPLLRATHPRRFSPPRRGGGHALPHPRFLAQHLNKIRLAGVLAALTFLALAIHAHTFFFVAAPINTWGFTLLALASAALLLSAIQPHSRIGTALSTPFLRFYGRYSYGLYLFHQAINNYDTLYIFPLFESRIHPLWLAGTIHLVLILALTTALAVLSFRYLEQPFSASKSASPTSP